MYSALGTSKAAAIEVAATAMKNSSASPIGAVTAAIVEAVTEKNPAALFAARAPLSYLPSRRR